MPTTPPRHNFDIDLDFGNYWEDRVCRMLEGSGSVEVKADRMWAKSGNLAFEYMRHDMQLDDDIITGILTSEASWWCSVLCSPTDLKKSSGIRIWETNKLKSVLALLLEQGRAWTRTGIGEGGRTGIILVPLRHLTENNLTEYELDPKKDYAIIRRRQGFQEKWLSAKENIEACNLLKKSLA